MRGISLVNYRILLRLNHNIPFIVVVMRTLGGRSIRRLYLARVRTFKWRLTKRRVRIRGVLRYAQVREPLLLAGFEILSLSFDPLLRVSDLVVDCPPLLLRELPRKVKLGAG